MESPGSGPQGSPREVAGGVPGGSARRAGRLTQNSIEKQQSDKQPGRSPRGPREGSPGGPREVAPEGAWGVGRDVCEKGFPGPGGSARKVPRGVLLREGVLLGGSSLLEGKTGFKDF